MAILHRGRNALRLPSIPVYRPKLPPARLLLPYLERADAVRWYTNRGVLVRELEARLSDALCGGPGRLVAASSGSAAIEAAILAVAGRATATRPYALVPAYTFVGTALAAQRCGYIPWLVDAAPSGWAMTPDEAADCPALAEAGVVVPVAPYGQAPDQAGWSGFVARTGVPVVIDAAASFEALARAPGAHVGRVPVALSFHATKAFSTGEGGAVAWSDLAGLARVVRALNFGFLASRVSQAPGLNGKMSEYHAAVGLAGLDCWDATTAANELVARGYRVAAGRLRERLVLAPDIASNYVLFCATDAIEAARVRAALTEAEAGHRAWYGRGLHHEPAFAGAPRGELPHAERLGACLIGLPIAPDIATDAIARVAAAIRGAVTA